MKKTWSQPLVEVLEVKASMAGGDDKTSPDGTTEYIDENGYLIKETGFNKKPGTI